jgi:predicted membrane chloride channel (bestrophin family)
MSSDHLDEHAIAEAAGLLHRQLDVVAALLGLTGSLRDTGAYDRLVEARVLCSAVTHLCTNLDRIDWRGLAAMVAALSKRLMHVTPDHPAESGMLLPQLHNAGVVLGEVA